MKEATDDDFSFLQITAERDSAARKANELMGEALREYSTWLSDNEYTTSWILDEFLKEQRKK